ncbi:MAG: serine/threonine-protein kinase, partial [Myxococcota bacterium]
MSELGILPNPIPYGKYYLLERVNIGGMAEIFKAKAFGVEGFERLLAVKKILSSIAEDEDFIDMFIDEAKIAVQLNHSNIAQIFDLGKVDESYFIALEYISGKDLKTIFERARRLNEKVSIPRVCYVLMKVCEGLGYAHEKKDAQGNPLHIVHRDVSPQNILASYEGEVKIIDFGIAKAQGKTSQTQVGVLKGKFSYMSPEQVRGLHIDHRSDLFSLGIVLYELLTLERLFLGESDFDTLERIRKVEMSPPSLYNPHIPKELEDIVLKALARSPEERYQTTFELADALEQFMRNQGYYYTNKDLAAYMKESFSADIEFEEKKLEYYRSLNLQPIVELSPESRVPSPGPPLSGLSWDDDEKDTQLFGRDDEAIRDELDQGDIVYSEDANPAIIGQGLSADEEPPTTNYNRTSMNSALDSFAPPPT